MCEFFSLDLERGVNTACWNDGGSIQRMRVSDEDGNSHPPKEHLPVCPASLDGRGSGAGYISTSGELSTATEAFKKRRSKKQCMIFSEVKEQGFKPYPQPHCQTSIPGIAGGRGGGGEYFHARKETELLPSPKVEALPFSRCRSNSPFINIRVAGASYLDSLLRILPLPVLSHSQPPAPGLSAPSQRKRVRIFDPPEWMGRWSREPPSSTVVMNREGANSDGNREGTRLRA
ncbi:hypothetical protein BDK51DRAFT_31755 [Blyttiomyces helicus]|uniref:Uncharacterized protein n=1 Tax=Blyttiomyces helicus TaxID=388810 RepID=A0A4P9W6H6_9FUNG|nr:hypothetical protein BDK51DRAFT_31755 [Blyttiomyces helicus]|eukprot:RKO86538.1 hypothetical protein BDK51DRAFT_31755 [Blyttiomyces helicus]